MNDRPADGSTVCPQCAVGCRLGRGDEESGVEGRSGPANPNGRLCPKGIRAFETASDEERLTAPRVRREGSLVPVSWEVAFQHVVSGFESVLTTRGADGLAFLGAPHCTNEENYLLQKLARTLGTNNVDNRSRLCHASTSRVLSTRLGWPATTNSLGDLSDATVILIVGANPAARQPVAFNSFVRPAVADGATLIHVDPVGNRTTRLADVHLAPRPGTDASVLTLLCALVRAEEYVDREFVADRTTGFAAFAAALEGIDVAERAAAAGVDAAVLKQIARTIGRADRVAAVVGTGVEGDTPEDTSAPDALLNLLLLTGNLGRRGTGIHLFRGLSNEQGAVDVGCLPHQLPGHRPVSDADARERFAAEWGIAPPSTPGESAPELLSNFGDGIRGALVIGENPAVSKHSSDWLRQRLGSLDLLVVSDLFPTETTAHADVVLPATAGVEKSGTMTNLDRHVQRVRPTCASPEGTRSDFAVLRELGRRLVGSTFDYGGPDAVFSELTRVTAPYSSLSYGTVGESRRQWPVDADDGVLYCETFETEGGKAPFTEIRPSIDRIPAEKLSLVVGGRTNAGSGEAAAPDRRLRIHPSDADDRGIETDDRVVVSNDRTTVETTVDLDESMSQGAVYLHASVADPLLRERASAVTVRPASR